MLHTHKIRPPFHGASIEARPVVLGIVLLEELAKLACGSALQRAQDHRAFYMQLRFEAHNFQGTFGMDDNVDNLALRLLGIFQ